MAHILLIDDDAGVRAGVGRFLQMQGHEVTEAADGAEAMRKARGLAVNLVVTDINMPDMDGIEVILELSKTQPGLPVIAISGGGRVPKELLLSSASLLGAVRTLAKPFELDELRLAVEAALKDGAAPHVHDV